MHFTKGQKIQIDQNIPYIPYLYIKSQAIKQKFTVIKAGTRMLFLLFCFVNAPLALAYNEEPFDAYPALKILDDDDAYSINETLGDDLVIYR